MYKLLYLCIMFYQCINVIVILLTSSIRWPKCISFVYSCIIEFFDIYVFINKIKTIYALCSVCMRCCVVSCVMCCIVMLHICVLFVLYRYICLSVCVHSVCVLCAYVCAYMCVRGSVEVCQLNPIPPMLVSYAGIW